MTEQRHMDSGSSGSDSNVPGRKTHLEPKLKWGKKTDEERFECNRFERRDKFHDFFKSVNRLWKKTKTGTGDKK